MVKGRHPRSNSWLGSPERVYPPLAEAEAKWEARKGLRQLQQAIMGWHRAGQGGPEVHEDEKPQEEVQEDNLLCQDCDMAEEEELDLDRFHAEEPQGQDDWGLAEIDRFFGLDE